MFCQAVLERKYRRMDGDNKIYTGERDGKFAWRQLIGEIQLSRARNILVTALLS